MNRLERLARGLLKPMNPYASSILGMLTLMWGIWIVNPFWSVFASANVWHRAMQFAPEWAWGTWATVAGGAILFALFKGSTKWVARTLGFGIWHWWTVSGMLWWGDWQNTAGLTYMFIAIYTTFSYLNIKTNFVHMGQTHF